MKAVLLAGGEGTRLRPLTYDLPKPLFPVVEIPYLQQLVYYLSKFGINEMILTSCYLSHQIEDFCRLNQGGGFKLTYVVEEDPLGTGGAVRNVSDHLDETFLVFNGDILTSFDLGDLIQFHREKKSGFTLALTPVEDPSRYGVAELEGNGRIKKFVEKPSQEETPSNFINAGMYVVEPRTLKLIPKGRKVSIEREVFPALAASAELYGCVQKKYWLDMGTPADYLRAHFDFLDRKVPLHSCAKWDGKNWMGKEVQIKPGARVIPPVLFGDRCIVESGATVGPYSVLSKGCKVYSGAKVERSVLWKEVEIGKKSLVLGSIFGDGVCVEENSKWENEIIRRQLP